MTENKKTEVKETKAPESIYERLSKVDVTPFIEKKNGLNYLSWAKAWGLVKSIYPDANYKFREYPYFEQTADGNYQPCGTRDYLRTEYGVEVEAVVTIQGQEYSSKLYVMDYHNRAMAPSKVTLFEINKTQMRALTKALAFAGLGLNIYAGEDLPSGADKTPKRQEKPTKDELITVAKERKAQYGGGEELVTDIVGLEMDGDRQADIFLNNWCAKNPKNQALYTFIKKNNLATHGMKAGA
ncbi:DUF1071 domain-containing protein [Lactobacillus helveticus]|uniref:DUF1071 domain-containing protein n=1 Tax=Lactobacillus helveticus TaxID=1587 RepID=UPI0021820A2F|nr:DUF1071 domain-containing protein [Lactobacillus helveticus]MCT0196518.1 DUF1071 domain-containing protein [Lactobacillus helveticus]